MTLNQIEMKIRTFLQEQLMKEQAEFLSLEDELELDSLDQTELRVFLGEELKIDTELDKVPPESLRTLKSIIGLVPSI
jgi:acyl carrier protein